MRLYDLSIRLNPDAGYVYYLRGLLHERDENLASAIADWRRSLDRLPASNPVSEARPTVITRRAENRPPLLTRSDPDGPHHGYCPRNAVAPLPPFQPAIVRQGRS